MGNHHATATQPNVLLWKECAPDTSNRHGAESADPGSKGYKFLNTQNHSDGEQISGCWAMGVGSG